MPTFQACKSFIRGMIQAIAIITAISIAGCEKKAPVALPLIFEDEVVMAFGDSLTYGTGADRNTSYPAVLASLSNRKIVNEGIPGNTTADGLSRLPDALKKHQPRLVLLCLGGNDFLRRISPAVTRRNMEALLGILKEQGIPVVLISVPQLGLGLQPAPMYKELAKAHDLPLVDEVLADILSQRSLKSDAIHPNAAGYRIMAEQLNKALIRFGAF